MAAPTEESSRRCKYFLERKRRFCKLIPGIGKEYCGEHMSFSSAASERRRISCPIDKKHTVYEDLLHKHLKKCNAKAKQNHVYYQKNVNAGSDDDSIEQSKVSISSMDPDCLKSIISKIKKYHNDTNIDLQDQVLNHDVFCDELNDAMNGDSARKHLLQQSSLLGHLQKNDLLKNGTCFIEFGAGRGQLSHWLQIALQDFTNIKFLLVDRGHNRRKLDCYHRHQGNNFERINLDISDLKLASVPCIHDTNQQIVGISKHLCGAATDLGLRCLINFDANSGNSSIAADVNSSQGNTAVDEPESNNLAAKEPQAKRLRVSEATSTQRQVSGIIFALCCHHQCNWKNYVGKKFFKELNFSPNEFDTITRLSSWAVCGTRKNKDADDAHSSAETLHGQEDGTMHSVLQEPTSEDSKDDAMSCQKAVMNRSDGLNAEERAEIGRQCKRLIDLGRVKYMQDHGFKTDLVYYIQREISLENVAIIATRKTTSNKVP